MPAPSALRRAASSHARSRRREATPFSVDALNHSSNRSWSASVQFCESRRMSHSLAASSISFARSVLTFGLVVFSFIAFGLEPVGGQRARVHVFRQEACSCSQVLFDGLLGKTQSIGDLLLRQL